jgi:hypothetical protein
LVNTLISGASSGLGKYLLSNLDSDEFDRTLQKPKNFSIPEYGYDLIIHAAFGMPNNSETKYEYKEYHLKLANKLLSIPHKRFVFISTVDASEKIKVDNWYGEAKQKVEDLCLANSNHAIILKCGAMFGPGMRKNQILKIASEKSAKLTLTKRSKFYLITYADVLTAIRSDLKVGRYYLINKKILLLSEVANYFNKNPEWGNYEYAPADIDRQIPRIYSKESSNNLSWLKEFIEVQQ